MSPVDSIQATQPPTALQIDSVRKRLPLRTLRLCGGIELLSSTHADRQGVDISLTVCVCLYGYGFLRR